MAALPLSFAQRGTGDVGPAVPRADGVCLPREQRLRGRDDVSLVGKFAVARTCDRTPGAPGIFPLDAQVNFPGRCDAYFLQEWMTGFAVEHPFQERSSWCEPLGDLEVAESVLIAVAQEAPADDEDCDAQRPTPQEEAKGERLVVRFDGKGVPMIKAEAVKLKAQLGTGEQRQKQKEALVGVSDTVAHQPRSPEALAELLVEPAAGRRHGRWAKSAAGPACGQPGADEAGGDGTDPGRRRTPGASAPQPLGRPARWRPRPVAPGDHTVSGVEAGDVRAGYHARRRLPLECGHRAVRGRLQGEKGKRWSLEGAEAILTRRSLKKSHDHALRDYWKFHARQVHRRLYDRKPNYRPMLRLRRVA